MQKKFVPIVEIIGTDNWKTNDHTAWLSFYPYR
jgi:hypothetical protein